MGNEFVVEIFAIEFCVWLRNRVGKASMSNRCHAMTAEPAVGENRLSRVLFLLALSAFINYLDCGNLSIAAPLLKNEVQLSATQPGVLLSSFFWTYSLFLPVSGSLVDRFNVKWVIAGGFFLWSAATAVTGMVHAFGTLLLARLALGAGESVCYPACSTILSQYFPERKRGFANATIVAGMSMGPAFGTLAGGILMGRFGWRPVFLVVGLVSLLWLLPWLRWMPVGHSGSVSQSRLAVPGMLDILEQRSAWGTCVGLFSMNYLLYFFLTWLPFYLVRERHFSLATMAKIAGMAYFLMAISAMFAGWASDRGIALGKTPTLVRKTFMVVGQLGAGISVAACVVSGPLLSVVCLLVAAASWRLSASNTWAITQTLAGPQASGKWTGLQDFLGNLAGVVAPALTGLVVDRTGRFFWAFIITAAIALLAILDFHCWRSSTGGLVDSRGAAYAGSRRFLAAKAIGSEQAFRASVKEVAFTRRVMYISSSTQQGPERKRECTSSMPCLSPHDDLNRDAPGFSLDRECHGFHHIRISSGHS